MVFYVHRFHKTYWGQGAQDDHLDFHTPLYVAFLLSLCFTSTETVRLIADWGRMGWGIRARAYLPVHTAPEL